MAPITMQFTVGVFCLHLVLLPSVIGKAVSPNVFQSNSKCHTIPYRMTVKKNGCQTIKVQTSICAGACLSLFIPQHAKAGMGTCSLCQPTKQLAVKVTFHCNIQGKLHKTQEKIPVVKSCGCNIKQQPCKQI